MKIRVAVLAALPLLALAAPLAAHAAGIPFFGPIIDPRWQNCALGWGAVIDVINNVIRLIITLLIVFIAPLFIAYAGFLYIVNPVSPEGKSRAKHVLMNVVIGLVVALAAWLIIDAILVALTGNSATYWTALITGGGANICL